MGSRDVIAQVVHDSLDCSTVEQVAVGVGELRLEYATDPPAGDGVRQRQREQADDGGEEVTEQRPIEHVADEKPSQSEIRERQEERAGQVVTQYSYWGLA